MLENGESAGSARIDALLEDFIATITGQERRYPTYLAKDSFGNSSCRRAFFANCSANACNAALVSVLASPQQAPPPNPNSHLIKRLL